MVVFMKETRSAVLLTQLAKKTRKETGDRRYRARVEDERADLTTLIYISCTRPVCECIEALLLIELTDPILEDLLFTEPVLASCSVREDALYMILAV